MQLWSNENLSKVRIESYSRFSRIRKNAEELTDNEVLRNALLDFVADFADWNNATDRAFLDASRKLTEAAHHSLGGLPGSRPLVVDPFAGGGSIPLEALRVGADAFASDLNPIAVLLNVIVDELVFNEEVISNYLAAAERVKKQVDRLWDRSNFAKFWSRTIQCEAPSCGVEIPLIRSSRISIRGKYALAFVLSDNGKLVVENSPISLGTLRPALQVVCGGVPASAQTCKNGSVTCPVCNFTHKQSQIAKQALAKGFGRRLTAVGQMVAEGKNYRSPSVDEERQELVLNATVANKVADFLAVPINPKRPSPSARGMSAVTRYGYKEFVELFSPKQLQIIEVVRQAIEKRRSLAPLQFRRLFNFYLQSL